MNRPNSPSLYSFFSGLGFLDLGFESEGFEVRFVNEIHAPFLDAYCFARSKLNLAHNPVYLNASIEALYGSIGDQIDAKIITDKKTGPVIFIGGPPCPDFSVGGKNRGASGENGRLTKDYFAIIRRYKPDIFLFENVKGLWRTSKHREFYEEMKCSISSQGYRLYERLSNALEFGVGQDRDRILLIGAKQDSSRIKSPTKETLDWTSYLEFPAIQEILLLKKAEIGTVPERLTVGYWFKKNLVEQHPNAEHGFQPRAALEKFKMISEGDSSKKSFKRLSRFSFSPTAAYGNNEVHIHPTQPRRINAAEAMAIQSLPKEFQLPAFMTLTNMFKGIGNGVPFLMAKGVAKLIKTEFLN